MSARTTSIVFVVAVISVGLLALYLLGFGTTSNSDFADVSVEADDGARDADRATVAADGDPVGTPGEPNIVAPTGDAADDPTRRQVSLPAQIVQALQLYQGAPGPALLDTERAFVAEPVDLLWAPSMEADIYSFFSKTAQIDGVQFPTIEVECRTSMCRLPFIERVSTSEPLDRPHPAVRALNEKLRAEFGDFRQGIFSVDPYGTATSLFYVSSTFRDRERPLNRGARSTTMSVSGRRGE